jgi:hypothetical protein
LDHRLIAEKELELQSLTDILEKKDMNTAQKRTVATRMHQQGIPVVVACRRLNLARSSAYYCPTTHADKSALSRRVVELALEHASFGYRKITHLLRLEGWSVNPNRVYRTWQERPDA